MNWPRDKPGVTKRVPQLCLFAGYTVDEQVDSLLSKQGRDHFAGQVGAIVGVVRGVHYQRQRCEKEMDQLWCIWVMDVVLQLCLLHFTNVDSIKLYLISLKYDLCKF